MHNDVARRWTIDSLAKEIGMSRSSLTLRFSQRVGRAPMDYLTRWRMILAERQLASGSSISDVALSVGYMSQSAFAPRVQARKRDARQEGDKDCSPWTYGGVYVNEAIV